MQENHIGDSPGQDRLVLSTESARRSMPPYVIEDSWRWFRYAETKIA